MNKELILSDVAEEDFKNIHDYIAEKLFNIKAANDLLDAFENAFDMIISFPESCPLDETENFYRKLIVKNYIAFYRVEEETITVHRILYGMSDYQKHL